MMLRRIGSLLIVVAAVIGLRSVTIAAETLPTGLTIETGLPPGEPVVLRGRDSRRQILVMVEHGDQPRVDATRTVHFTASPEGIVSISDSGYVSPIAAGQTTITATYPDSAVSSSMELTVADFSDDTPVNFPNQVVPVFTKLACNGGGCHGKSAGQNGFRLSLLGFHPRDDYEFLVRESRGRRLFPAMPEKSLLLTKATSEVPHGGGQRMDKDSDEYRLVRRWIGQGMPYGSDDDPKVTSIAVHPENRVMRRNGSQQLIVLARYSDGHVEDVTRMAQFESNDSEMAEVDVDGLVKTRDLAGDVTVMTRFQGQVAVFRSTMPLSDTPPMLPTPGNLVDREVFAKLNRLGIPTSPRCDDSAFLRRVTIDLAGRLPTMEETQAMLADQSPEKRDVVIDRLLSSTDHAEYFAGKWSQILRNRRDNEAFKFGSYALYQWLRNQIHQNRPYDAMVRDIVAASGSLTVHPPVAWYRQVSDINQQVEDASQLFLGQRIQCARCHHHPYERWSQQDYAQMAGFFSLVSKKAGPTPQEPIVYSRIGRPSASDPRTGAALPPAGLGSDPIEIDEQRDPRDQLVDWMVQQDNPYFAPSLVNRYWKHFFGRGLVDPEDDMRVTNPPSNPELLQAMSSYFIESGFDQRELIRLIVSSKTYQLSSDANELNLNDKRNHSRYYPKRLAAEVLLDSIDDVLGTVTTFDAMPVGTRAVELPDTSFDSYFLTVFGRPEATTACECERSIDSNLAQSLHLLNSKQMQTKITDPAGTARQCSQQLTEQRAAAASDAPSAEPKPDPATAVDALIRSQISDFYLRALCRYPKPEELNQILNYIRSSDDPQIAYEDTFWAIVNSKEFLFNH
jgi:hypothetical protein